MRKASGFPEFQLLAAVWLWKREGLECPTKEEGKGVITFRTAWEEEGEHFVHCDCHPGQSLHFSVWLYPGYCGQSLCTL